MAAAPIIIFLTALAALRWPPRRAAFAAFLLALVLAVGLFGLTPQGTAVALAKGVLFALFVLLVVWAALLLYALMDQVGAIDSIGWTMFSSVSQPANRGLTIAWVFSGFLQGFAGFGAPIASVVPLLRMAGFERGRAIVAAMVGHSWAITFGSMGSSYFAIQLATRLPGEVIAPWIAGLFALPIILTGLSVLHILMGWYGLRTGAPLVILIGAAMAFAMWCTASLGAAPMASTIPALLGWGLLWLFRRGAPAARRAARPVKITNVHLAFLPYYTLIGMTLALQIGPLGDFARGLTVGVDLPATATTLGYHVLPEAHFPRLRVLQHPATLIVIALAITVVAYDRASLWPQGALQAGLRRTYRQSVPTSTAVLFMVMFALLMADSGMASTLAGAVATLFGPVYPFVSPFVELLGSFMTGSNTNSNVTMGGPQLHAAVVLGLAPALIAAAQTVGASLGSGISPDKTVIGAAVAGIHGHEGTLLRRALPYGLGIIAVVGVEVLVLAAVHAAG